MATRRQIVVKSKRLKAHKQHKLRKNKAIHEKQTKTVVRLMNRQKRGGARPIDVPFSNAWGKEKADILQQQLAFLERSKTEKAQDAARRKERKRVNAERTRMGLPPLPSQNELAKQKAAAAKAQQESIRTTLRASTMMDEDTDGSQLAALNARLAVCHLVIHVCDARDPMGSRSPELERHCVEAGRPVILLLNKFDLVSKDVLTGWLKVLRSQPPPGSTFASADSGISSSPSWTSVVPFSATCAKASVDLLNTAIQEAAQHHQLPSPTVALIVGPPRSGRGTIVKACLLNRAVNLRGQIRVSQHVLVVENTMRLGGGGRVDLDAVTAAVGASAAAGASKKASKTAIAADGGDGDSAVVDGLLPQVLLRSRRVAPSSCKLLLALLLVQSPSGSATTTTATGAGARDAAACGLLHPNLWGMLCCAYAVDQSLKREELTPLRDVTTKGMNDAAARVLSGSDRLTAAPVLLSRIAAQRSENVEDVARLVYMQWETQAPRTPRWWVAPPTDAAAAADSGAGGGGKGSQAASSGASTPGGTSGATIFHRPSLASTREVEEAVWDYSRGQGGSADAKYMAFRISSAERTCLNSASFVFDELVTSSHRYGKALTRGDGDGDGDDADESDDGDGGSDDDASEQDALPNRGPKSVLRKPSRPAAAGAAAAAKGGAKKQGKTARLSFDSSVGAAAAAQPVKRSREGAAPASQSAAKRARVAR